MRKRHVTRPRLESMEDRLALSTGGVHAVAAEVQTARAARLEARHAADATRHHDDAATPHHHAVKHAHHAHPPSKSNSSSSSNNIFSQFIKSAFGGL